MAKVLVVATRGQAGTWAVYSQEDSPRAPGTVAQTTGRVVGSVASWDELDDLAGRQGAASHRVTVRVWTRRNRYLAQSRAPETSRAEQSRRKRLDFPACLKAETRSQLIWCARSSSKPVIVVPSQPAGL